jgi:3,4-dihydroxy-2-butanone 4-phosphate synthase
MTGIDDMEKILYLSKDYSRSKSQQNDFIMPLHVIPILLVDVSVLRNGIEERMTSTVHG